MIVVLSNAEHFFSLQSMTLDPDGGSLSPNSKPHICEHCNAAFRSSYHLRRHVLIHTGQHACTLARERAYVSRDWPVHTVSSQNNFFQGLTASIE